MSAKDVFHGVVKIAYKKMVGKLLMTHLQLV
jgi:hypothetical protein